MRKVMMILLTFCYTLLLAKGETKPLIYQIDIRKDIGATTWLYLKKGFAEANKSGAKVIVIRLNTYGGEVVYADSMRTRILNSKIPVIAFIDNNAASAGALIAIACDKIYMRTGASFGAATVVDQTGGQLPDKYQSYMRATIRSTAEAHGKDTIITGKDTIIRWKRDPHIAEAMVDNRIIIPNVVDSGRTLTFTTNEAIKNRYCEGKAESVDDIISKQMGIKDYDLKVYKPSGFGIAGISGIILIICGLTLSMIDNINLDFSRVPGGEIAIALFTVLISIAVAFGLSIYLSNKIGQKGIFRRVALEAEQEIAQGFVGVPTEPQQIVGKIGIAATVLRPSGKVMVESNFYDAVSEHGFIEQGTAIKVTRYEAGQVYVIKSEE
ncbi:NfeD family protein [Paludibacter sp.]|uniref:NfeD family protein n=1 Tax=Paludibacter sp. TaxID=1898105 RepID=UPI0013547D10|nr:NfeD family protein [Paludibacter sp.]MTK53960.1 nodulation protein NfeD [Paludibacter sp.]